MKFLRRLFSRKPVYVYEVLVHSITWHDSTPWYKVCETTDVERALNIAQSWADSTDVVCTWQARVEVNRSKV